MDTLAKELDDAFEKWVDNININADMRQKLINEASEVIGKNTGDINESINNLLGSYNPNLTTEMYTGVKELLGEDVDVPNGQIMEENASKLGTYINGYYDTEGYKLIHGTGESTLMGNIDNVNTSVGNVNTSVGTLDANLNGTGGTMNKLNTTVGGVTSAVGGVTTALTGSNGIGSKLDGVGEKVNSFYNAFTGSIDNWKLPTEPNIEVQNNSINEVANTTPGVAYGNDPFMEGYVVPGVGYFTVDEKAGKRGKYAKGTLSAKKGIAEIWEEGPEIIRTAKGTFIPLQGGEGIVPAQETANLIKMARGMANGGLKLQMPDMSAYAALEPKQQQITNNATSAIHIDSLITINGNADQSTVEQIRQIAEQLIRDKRFSENITNLVTKNQAKDARMAGRRNSVK